MEYTADASALIERGYRSGISPVILQGSNIRGYLVDFSNPNEFFQINEITKYRRRVKRGD
jgi:WWE domain